MKWKQFWCNHIWKNEKEDYLRTEREKIVVMYADYAYYAKHQNCVKCTKHRVYEVRKLII